MSDEPKTETLPELGPTFVVESVYGAKTRRPMVRLALSGNPEEAAGLRPRDALQLGMQLIGAAHAAIGDAAALAAIGAIMQLDGDTLELEDARSVLSALRMAREAIDDQEGTGTL